MAKGNIFARQNAESGESSGNADNKRSHHAHAHAGRLNEADVGRRPINFKAVGRVEDYAWQDEEEDINECADEFIRRFRQNLLLQRLQSIENYKQMLARGH